MSDSDGKKTLGLRGGPRAGNVKQSFSHGRSKSVVVETKRKRVVVPKSGTIKPLDGAQVAGTTINARPCLLYTSPSPRDSDSSRMPSSA